ncbi:MAG: hypothetical protein COU25_01980 [Candidatus Levybacteria bacterium CG10_big_fil_rev_8_21_14_0_10_35_13]|nr:MAG: hypothetical protein COU25_01980 [Candidatus Levybacteria bacterium CG10_big_fil_rev_8_21_14_0_10_35_13]
MKERGIGSQNSQPELIPIQSGLTQEALNPTLGEGDIFMAQEGVEVPQSPQGEVSGGPRTVEDTVSHLARARVKRELDQAPLPIGEFPPGFGKWPTELQGAYKGEQRERAAKQVLTQQLVVREDPHAISPSQQEALDNVRAILPENPEAFAESYVRAIDTLSQKRAEPIVHGEAIRLVEQVLGSADIPEESRKRFRKRAEKALSQTPPETTRSLRRIIKDVGKEPQRLEKQSERRTARQTTQEPAPKPAQAEEPVVSTQVVEPTVVEVPPSGPPPRLPPAPPAGPSPEGEGERPEEVSPAPLAGPEKRNWLDSDIRAMGDQMRKVIGEFIPDPSLASEVSGAHYGGNFSFEEMQEEIAKRRRVIAQTSEEDGERLISVPQSLEDIAELVMKRSDPKWSRGHERALINEDGKVNTAHFLDWARNNMFRVHNFNPTSGVNFFTDQGMGVKTDIYGSVISFYEIVFTESYWLDKETVNINNQKVIRPAVNEDYKKLKDQLITEVFLFMLMRNAHIDYYFSRADGKAMIEKVNGIFQTNPLTRSNFFEFILSQPSLTKLSIKDLEAGKGKEMEAKLDGNFYMGEAVRRALASYISIYDYGQLAEILGKDAILFKRDYQESKAQEGELIVENGVPKLKPISADVSPIKAKDREKEWFYTAEDVKRLAQSGITVVEGHLKKYVLNRYNKPVKADISKTNLYTYVKIKGESVAVELDPQDGKPLEDYMEYINVFTGPGPMPDQRKVVEIRERIIQSIMDKCGIPYREAQLAEAWAFSMTHFTGVAARNDTHSIAFDFWTRLQNLRGYRLRQKAEKRGANYGLKHNMDGFKRIGFNFFEGARDIRLRSIQEIILGGTGGEIGIDKTPVKNVVDYERDENGLIKFFDQNGNEISGLTATNYELYEEANRIISADGKEKDVKETKVRYLDGSGNVVEVGQNHAKTKITKVDKPIEFNTDLQRQFIPNHLQTGAEIYGFIMEQIETNFADCVTGYDNRGNPILDHEKLNKLKKGIVHDLRYMISTWSEINFTEKQLDWERIEVRDDNRRLIAKKKDEDDETQYLDEDWYILDSKGNRTKERDEPELVLQSRPMTRLESMFGVGALKHIQFEIGKRKLTYSKKDEKKDKDEGKNSRNVIVVDGWNSGKHETVEVDLSHADSDEFKIAVWKGALEYLLASEVTAHRSWDSNLAHWSNSEVKRYYDAIVDGEVLTSDETGSIRKETKTETSRLLAQDMTFATTAGGGAGILKSLRQFFASAISGK